MPSDRPNDLEAVKSRAIARVDADREALLTLSGRIHANPELAFNEHRAAGWLCDYLESRGLAVERGAYGLSTAFVARIGSGRPHVAVLCEYDALPGIGHACGHNVIATAGAGAGAALAEVVRETGGSIVVLGTPAEEYGGGKVLMAREGAFADVDAALMIHPACLDLLSMNALAVTTLEVEYHGRAAHAAGAPHKGINALDGLVTAYQAIAQLRQHIRPSERIHGMITNGGQAPNVVPERAAGVFLVRAATEAHRAQLRARVEGCLRAGGLASGAECHVHSAGEDYSDLWTNPPLATAFEANLHRVGRRVVEGAQVTGSTDMGNISKLVPSIHPMISIAPVGVALHTKEFAEYAGSAEGQRGTLDGAKALALTAIDVLCRRDLFEAARIAFAAQAEQSHHPTADD